MRVQVRVWVRVWVKVKGGAMAVVMRVRARGCATVGGVNQSVEVMGGGR